MFERISRGIELARQSFAVLMDEKKLLVFPLLSGIAAVFVFATFAVPLWTTGYAEQVLSEKQAPQDPIAYAILFLFYFVNYFVIVFFNSALISCAIIRFQGGSPTLGDGLREASSRLPQIVAWALVSATVGVILKAIESRSEKVGQFVANLIGAGWTIVTYFVVPVIVVERAGPIDAVKRSFAILRKTWGESLTANFGIGFVVFMAILLAMVPAVGGFVLSAALNNAAAAVIGIVLSVVLVILVSLVSAALHTIIVAALYLFAAQGQAPPQFDQELLSAAYRSKG